MVVLPDTSIWVDHLRGRNANMREQLDSGFVLVHPLVIGELACGNLPNRSAFLEELADMNCAVVASDDEVMELIEGRKPMGRGIGFVDMHLVASTMLTQKARLWTRDARLYEVVRDLGLQFDI